MISPKNYYFPNFVYYNEMSNSEIFQTHMLASVLEVSITYLLVKDTKEVSNTWQKECWTRVQIKIFIF